MINGIVADGFESYLDIDISDGDGNYVDVHVFVLDTGVLSTHDEFTNIGINIIHGLDTFTDESISKGHGTHMASLIAGENTGIIKSGTTIYEYPVCSRTPTSTSCFWQELF